MLKSSPELEAKALFEWLSKRKGGTQQGVCARFRDRWKDGGACTKPDRDAGPGTCLREAMQVDGTWMTELEVTIVGEPFKHLLIRCVLPYSGGSGGELSAIGIAECGALGAAEQPPKMGYVPQIRADR
ncbi:MAG: hypothetical protein R3A44_22350 [Caldilineaceae bacterium]